MAQGETAVSEEWYERRSGPLTYNKRDQRAMHHQQCSLKLAQPK